MSENPPHYLTLGYQPWQQRVIDEKSDLDIRCAALQKFIHLDNKTYADLPFEECQRLCCQYELMLELSQVLAERIAAFKI